MLALGLLVASAHGFSASSPVSPERAREVRAQLVTKAHEKLSDFQANPKIDFLAKQLLKFGTHAKGMARVGLDRYKNGAAKGYVHLREFITGDGSARRRLNAGEDWLNDMIAIGERIEGNTVNGFDDLFTSFQQASCSGGAVKPDLKSLIDEALGQLDGIENPLGGGYISLNFNPLVDSMLGCICSGQWDLGAAELDTFYQKARDLVVHAIEGDQMTNAIVSDFIKALKGALPKFMSANAFCNTDCQDAYVKFMELAFEANTAIFGDQLPADAVAALPGDSVGCACGGTVQYDQFLEHLFPTDDEYALVSDVFKLLDDGEEGSWIGGRRLSHEILATYSYEPTEDLIVAILQRVVHFVDFIFSSGFLCGGTCPAAVSHGTTISVYATIYAVWPQVVRYDLGILPTALTSDRPTEAEIKAATMSQISCVCSLDMTGMYDTALPYFLNGFGDNVTYILTAVEDIIDTVMDGTPDSGGFCSTGHCPDMLKNYAKMASGMLNRALTTNYGEWPDQFQLMSPGYMSKAKLQSWFDVMFECFCSYWSPSSTGDIFSWAIEKVHFYETHGAPNDIETAVVQTVNGAFNAAGMCSSGSCRNFFGQFFDWVKSLSTGTMSTDVCTSDNVDKCWAGSCSPLSQGYYEATTECKMCYEGIGAYQKPLSHFGEDVIARYLYWGSCSLKSDCPPEGVKEYTITQSFTLEIDTIAEFDQEQFKKNYAALINVDGVTSDMVQILNLRLGSVKFDAVVTSPSVKVKKAVEGATAGKSANQLSAAIGVPVTAVESPQVEALQSPPSPPPTAAPPPPPDVFEKKDGGGLSQTAIIAIGAGAGGAVLVLTVLVLCFCCKPNRHKRDSSTGGGVTMQGGDGLKRDHV